jgi:formamidopyrimidine-DNA glycosylase
VPELPEAETIKRQLEQTVVGHIIVRVEIPVPRVLHTDQEVLEAELAGVTIIGAARRGKNIVVQLSTGKAVLFHLMIAGSLLYKPVGSERLRNTQVVLVLDNDYELRFRDLRKFGYVKLLDEPDVLKAPEFSHMGPEPLSPEFTLDLFKELIDKRSRSKIKALLLDQSFIAGIWNIYADEILFFARVHPERAAGSLDEEEVTRIYDGIRSILPNAIEERGSSIASYVDLFGEPGKYSEFHEVFNRTGEPCPRSCGGKIEKTKVAGRGTHICSRCQK